MKNPGIVLWLIVFLLICTDDVIKLVAKSGTFLTPTLQVCYGKEEGKKYFRKLYGQDFLNRSSALISGSYKRELLSDINAASLDSGSGSALGSVGPADGWAFKFGSITNGNDYSCRGLGMQKDLGSIEVGKIADLIILDKNPLEEIHNTTSIKYVMKAGVLYESETLDELWPDKRKGPASWR